MEKAKQNNYIHIYICVCMCILINIIYIKDTQNMLKFANWI